MDPLLQVGLALAGFALSHVGLGAPPLRRWLVARLGRWGFVAFFSLVAWLTFAAVITSYAAHAHEGPPGLALGTVPVLRPVLIVAIVVGAALMAGGLVRYALSPFAPGGERVDAAYGLERVTRHPFFIGAALMGGAHTLLATRAIGALVLGGIAAFSLFGAWLQDRKLLALRGAPYARYLAVTSLLPFAAIAAGRQRLVASELPWVGLAAGVASAWLLHAVHAHIFAAGGAYVIAVFVLGPLALLVGSWLQDRRAQRAAAAAAR